MFESNTAQAQAADNESASSVLTEAIHKAMTDARGNWDRAAELLKLAALHDSAVRDELLLPLLDNACREAVRKVSRDTRTSIISGQGRAARGSEGIRQLARTWYDWPLRNGLPLGRAKRSDVQIEYSTYKSLADANGVRARFFQLIADALPDGKVVKSALTLDKLNQFAKESGLEVLS